MSDSRYALLSVTDKTNLVGFAGNLKRAGFTLISTGGTGKELKVAGFDIVDVADFTGVPEMFEGRLKTLHPKIFGGILAPPTKEGRAQLKKLGWVEIDVVVVNLYDFAKTIEGLETRTDLTPRDELAVAIENVDIGGPSLLRAASKNYRRVTVASSPDCYANIAQQIDDHGNTSEALRLELATKVFEHTSTYDRIIHQYMSTHFFADE